MQAALVRELTDLDDLQQAARLIRAVALNEQDPDGFRAELDTASRQAVANGDGDPEATAKFVSGLLAAMAIYCQGFNATFGSEKMDHLVVCGFPLDNAAGVGLTLELVNMTTAAISKLLGIPVEPLPELTDEERRLELEAMMLLLPADPDVVGMRAERQPNGRLAVKAVREPPQTA